MRSRRSVSRTHLVVTLGLAVLVGLSAPAGAATVDDVMKQVDKVTKGVKGITADAAMVDVEAGEEKSNRSGKAFVSLGGKLRIEIGGDDPMNILCIPSDVYVHRPSQMTVAQFKRQKHPERLEQYALVGFSLKGNQLKQEFLMTLIEEGSLDGSKVVQLELTPKEDALRAAISKIHLWLDQSTYLPIQQRIFHGAAETHLTIKYSNVSREDKLDQAIFKPSWPKGTTKLKE